MNQNKKYTPTNTALPVEQGKIPPQAQDLEANILGVCLDNPEMFEQVSPILVSEDCFYGDAHRKIYAAMIRLHAKGAPIDLLTVSEELRKTGELELIGGAYYLSRILTDVTSLAHTETHARIVVDKYIKRQLIRAGYEAVKNGYDDSIDAYESVEVSTSNMLKLGTTGMKKKVNHVKADILSTLKNMHEQRLSKRPYAGATTGFSDLNRAINGLCPSDFIIVAARPSVGKTALLANICLNTTAEYIISKKDSNETSIGCPSALFMLEIPKDQINKRLLAAISKVEFEKIVNPSLLSVHEWTRLEEAARVLANLEMYIDDTAGLTLTEFVAKAKILVAKHGVKVIGIDYLQLMSGDGKDKGNREQEISRISRGIKKLAMELDICIIALSQMSRGVDKEDREPELSDLRESGSLEQDADIVIFLHRPGKTALKDNPQLKGKILATIKKNRNGPLKDILLDADNKTQRWLGQGDFEKPVDRYVSKNVPTVDFSDTNKEAEGYKAPEPIDDLPF